MPACRRTELYCSRTLASSARRVAGSRILARCGHSALTWPNSDSIHAWSVGVPGRPKCWWMAHSAMNSLVEPEGICRPLSLKASSTGRGGVVHGRVDQAVVAGADPRQQPFALQRVGEHDLDLGR